VFSLDIPFYRTLWSVVVIGLWLPSVGSLSVLVIFLLQKLRPRLRAIFRSSRKYHDFSK